MLKLFLVGVFIFYNIFFVSGESMIGPGKWTIYRISHKQAQINDIVIDLQQSMLNRTHYVYSGKIITHEPLDGGLGIKLDVCKFVDGGCKQFQVMTDDSFVAFANKFAEENIKECFDSMGVEPPELPLGIGEYEVENFMFDVNKLPEECTYGRFIAEVCAMRGSMPVGCIECECEFEDKGSDEDEDDC